MTVQHWTQARENTAKAAFDKANRKCERALGMPWAFYEAACAGREIARAAYVAAFNAPETCDCEGCQVLAVFPA